MAIKRVTLNTLTFLVNEIKERYTEKTEIGALGHLDKVAVEHLAEDLKKFNQWKGKRSYHTCRIRHYGRHDSHRDCASYLNGGSGRRPFKPCDSEQHGRY